jgi:MoxR-like ATPase
MQVSLNNAITQIGRVVLGKEKQVRMAICCVIARGHLLIEDIPGVGKTTLAQILARVLGLDFKRIQFTSDLLPADIIGVSIYQPETQQFRFHAGPIFAQLILADEINRATPKTQSALLEAMEERQVTYDGTSFKLPEPFFVVATQNPHHQIGTFPLPESQLDRFLMRIEMGYPDRSAERDLLKGGERREMLNGVQPALTGARLLELQRHAERIYCSDALMGYIQDLLAESRQSPLFARGLSPRAGLALLRAARAWALLEGRDMVLPEDVQALAPGVFGHRLLPGAGSAATHTSAALVADLVQAVPIP